MAGRRRFSLTWRTAIAAALCLVIAGAIPAAFVTIWLGPQIQANRQTVDAIVEAQRRECEADERFRTQYKLRGKAEKMLLELFVGLARESVADPSASPEEVRQSENFLIQFEPLTRRIEIIKPPDCDELVRDLEENL